MHEREADVHVPSRSINLKDNGLIPPMGQIVKMIRIAGLLIGHQHDQLSSCMVFRVQWAWHATLRGSAFNHVQINELLLVYSATYSLWLRCWQPSIHKHCATVDDEIYITAYDDRTFQRCGVPAPGLDWLLLHSSEFLDCCTCLQILGIAL